MLIIGIEKKAKYNICISIYLLYNCRIAMFLSHILKIYFYHVVDCYRLKCVLNLACFATELTMSCFMIAMFITITNKFNEGKRLQYSYIALPTFFAVILVTHHAFKKWKTCSKAFVWEKLIRFLIGIRWSTANIFWSL